MKTKNIFVDMDDVVADWYGYAKNYLKCPDWTRGEILPVDLWESLKDDQRMYAVLPPKESSGCLIDYLKDYCLEYQANLAFLTAIPHENDFPFAIYDKVNWAREWFPGIPVMFGPYAKDKHSFCRSSSDILIDDRRSNIEDWKAAGGIGFLYTDFDACVPFLLETLPHNKSHLLSIKESV